MCTLYGLDLFAITVQVLSYLLMGFGDTPQQALSISSQRVGVGNSGSVSTLPVLAKKDLVVLSIYAFGISKPEC